MYLQFDIFERRPSVAALSDDSSDVASPGGSRAASRGSSRAASAGPRATAAFAAQAAAALSSIAEPAGELRCCRAPRIRLWSCLIRKASVATQSATVRSAVRRWLSSAAPDTAVSQSSAQVTDHACQRHSLQMPLTAAAVQVLFRQSHCRQGAPLRDAVGDSGLTVSTK